MTYQLSQPAITVDAALRDLAGGSDRARARAAHALGDVTDPADRARAVSALADALRDRHVAVRTEAALSLGDLESEAAVDPLVDRLSDSEPQVRQAAAIALGRLGLSKAFGPMARALADGPPDLRFQAATSLAEIDPARAGGPLCAALDDGDGEVVAAAALSLGAIGHAAAADALAALLDVWAGARTRFDIAYALADLGDARGLPVLCDALTASGKRANDGAWDAVEGLDKLARAAGADGAASPDVTPAIADALAGAVANRKLATPVALRAAAALLRIADGAGQGGNATSDAKPANRAEAARARLLAGLGDRKLEHRGLAVQLLADVGGPWALAPLEQLSARRAGRPLADEIAAATSEIRSRGQ